MQFKDLPIRKKLTRGTLLISVITLLVISIVLFVSEFYSFRKTSIDKLSTIGKIISSNSTAALAFNNPADAKEILSGLRSEPNIVAACLYDKDGNIFAQYPSGVDTKDFPAKPEMQGYHFANSYLRGFEPVLQGNTLLGTLYLKSDLEEMYARFRLFGITTTFLIGVSFLLALFLSRILQKSISTPVLALSETAKAISEQKDYSARAVKISNDELGSLTDAFNHMLIQIQEQTLALNEFNRKLEQKVKERTAELEAANNGLKDSEEQIQTIFRSAPDAVIVIDEEGKIVRWNSRAETLFGWRANEVIGIPLHETIIPDRFRASHQRGLKHFLKTGEGSILNKAIEMPAIRKDGTEFEAGLSISPTVLNGKYYFIGFISDISPRKKAETEIKQKSQEVEHKNQLLTGIAEINNTLRGTKDVPVLAQDVINKLAVYLNAQIGAIYISENENTLQWAAGYAYNRKEKEQRSISFGEGLVGQAAIGKKSILLSRVPENYFKVNSGLGEIVPANIIVLPFIHAGNLQGVIELGSIREFTSEQVEYLNLVADAIGVAFNSARSRERMQELLEETQRQAEELETKQEELKQFNKDLEKKTEQLEASESELKTQQEELQQTNEELEEKANLLEQQKQEIEKAKLDSENKARELEITSRYKSEFLSTMSHELRTPLNSILILAKLLSENEKIGKKEVESAKNIYDSGNELLSLINEILDLARIESGRMEIDAEEFSLPEIERKMNNMFREVAKNRSIDFFINYEKSKLPQTIYTDSQKLEQILRNLLANAFKFTDKGGKVLLKIFKAPENTQFVNKKLFDSKNIIAFSVEDTGIGIPKDKQMLVFEAFRQADSSTKRKYGGSGLGLSISKELSNLLGGEIQLQSEEKKGSTFTLYLPEKIDSATLKEFSKQPLMEKDEKTEKINTLAASDNVKQKITDDRDNINWHDRKVLIIEDDQRFSSLLLDFIRERKYKGLLANEGNAGLELARQYKPDAILLDMKLPDMDGEEILKKLKSDPSLQHIPVQVISGYDKKKESVKLGALDFIKKPVEAEDLKKVFGRIEEINKRKIKKLLVVDDNQQVNKAIIKLLEGGDIECSAAYTGDEAYKKLITADYDGIILDLSLPDILGVDLLKKIRDNKKLASIHIIVYTGKELDKKETQELNNLANTVILKTSDSPERLQDEIKLFLHKVGSGLPQEKQSNIQKLHSSDKALKGRKVLITDDDMRNVYALTNVLEQEGMEYYTAENGKEALGVLKKNPGIEIVLMDIMMPEMDGFEATAEIRKIEKFKKLPIIALTAKAAKEMREKCIEAGMSDYIAKPLDIDKLLSLMRVWLFK